MSPKTPKTPFATRLSGSAKETELRLRSIFQWKKQRPPIWLLALVMLLAVGCGGLVSCQPADSMPDDPVGADVDGEFFANYQAQFADYIYSGETALVRDGRTLTLEDIPENPVEELLIAPYDSEKFQTVVIHSFDTLTEADFTPGGDWFADKEHADQFLLELNKLVAQRSLTEYVVVCADVSWAYTPEQLALGPQSGGGRYERLFLAARTGKTGQWMLQECFWGEYVLGRSNTARNIMDRAALKSLYASSTITDVEKNPGQTLLLSPADEGVSFTAACFTHRDSYELVIGVWDADAGIQGAGGELVGTVFRAANSGGVPRLVSFEDGGEQYLLYTANGMSQGHSGGQAGLIRLLDGAMNWTWPVAGDVRAQYTRDPSGQPFDEYLAYWDNHFALMCPGGVEVFVENEDYGPYEGSPPQWKFASETYFYDSGNRLAIDDLFQAREWIETFMRDGNEDWDVRNDSASWRIVDLERSKYSKKCILLCRNEYDDEAYLKATLLIPHLDQGPPEPVELLSWAIGRSEQDELERVDTAMYRKVRGVLDNLIQTWCSQENSSYTGLESPVFYGGDVIAFWPIARYDDMYPGSVTYLYELEIGLHSQYPEHIMPAEGNWVDELDRLRNGDMAAYLFLEERDGIIVTIVTANALSEDSLYTLGDEEGGEAAQRKMTKAALDVVRRDNMERDEMLRDYIQSLNPRHQVYFMNSPEEMVPESYLGIRSITYLGEAVLYETVGEAYAVEEQIHMQSMNATQAIFKHVYVIARSGVDGVYQRVLGECTDTTGLSVEEIVRKVGFGIYDLEVSLYRDGYALPLAIGNFYDLYFHPDGDTPTVERIEGVTTIYQSGDYWDRYTRKGVSIVRYYHANGDYFSNFTVDVTRDDFYTPRGIHVGSTREEVQAAYPELYRGHYWHDTSPDFPGSDYLWYCDNPEGWGAAMLFFFKDDVVTHIRLNNMFN